MAPESLGALLRRERNVRGWSQARLAEVLCEVSGRSTVTRHEVYRWERGRRVPRYWLPHIAVALGVERTVLERATVEPEEGPPLAHESFDSLLPDGEFPGSLTTRVRPRIDLKAARDLDARVHALRLADDVLAGGDLIIPARRELATAVRLYQAGTHTEEVGQALLVTVGELAQIVGWIESDAGQYNHAEWTYRLGLSAAREAEATTLVGNIAGSLAYQWTNIGRERDGAELARAALEEAGPNAHPTARALFFDRVAWANAKSGDAPQAIRALGEAHQALDREDSDAAPMWAYWVTHEELEVMDARVYTELHRPLRAVPVLREVLTKYDATHTREMALYLSWLIIAYADANEPEAAAETAGRMLTFSEDVASQRTVERTDVVLNRLRDFRDVAEVRAILDEHQR